MALNSSGPISLAGTTVGQSIEIENGGNGTTQISLNDTAVRTLAGVPSGAITMPTNFWGKSNASSFIGTLTAASYSSASNVGIDSSGNLYVVGSGGATKSLLISKYTPSGTLSWKYNVTTLTDNYTNASIAFDSSQQPVVYCLGGFGTNIAYLFKFDTSGALLLQKTLTKTGTSYNFLSASEAISNIALDSSDNIYVAQTVWYVPGCSEYRLAGIVKLNSSGTVQWKKETQLVEGGNTPTNIVVDAAGSYIYITKPNGLGGQSSGYLGKFQASGAGTTSVWDRWFYAGGFCSPRECIYYGLSKDSSDNLYPIGRTYNYGFTGVWALINKFNSSGTLQWTRRFGSGSGTVSFTGYASAVDSSGNVYAVARDNAASPTVYIMKYNSSGTLQWQRSLIGPAGSTTLYIGNVEANGTTFINLALANSAYTSAVILQLPSDGSKTGTLTVGGVNYTYAVSSLTSATTTSYSTGYPNFGWSNTQLTDATPTKTVGANSMTSAVTIL